MRIEKELVEKYITEDGRVFYDLSEAEDYERDLIRDKLYKKSHRVDDYIIYKIESKDELDSLVTNNYGQTYVYFNITKDLIFPIWVCETTDPDCYYFIYELLENVIYKHIDIIDKLKAIQKK